MAEVKFTENPIWWLTLNIVSSPIILGLIAVDQIAEQFKNHSNKIQNKKNYQSLPIECKEIVDISRKMQCLK